MAAAVEDAVLLPQLGEPADTEGEGAQVGQQPESPSGDAASPSNSSTSGGGGESESDGMDDEFGSSDRGGGSSGASDADDADDAQAGGSSPGAEPSAGGGDSAPRGGKAGFIAGGKGASFAKAFAKVMDTSARVGQRVEVPILAASKSVTKRAAEQEAAEKTDREAKRLRHELRKRGRADVQPRGADPVADQVERQLQRIATRGVVQLFNAVAKAQRAAKDALLTGLKGKPAMSKAAFFQELKGQPGAAQPAAQQLVPGAAPRAAGTAPRAPSWDVLRSSFTGLQGASKMKDWDRQQGSGGSGSEQPGSSSDEDDDEGDDGW